MARRRQRRRRRRRGGGWNDAGDDIRRRVSPAVPLRARSPPLAVASLPAAQQRRVLAARPLAAPRRRLPRVQLRPLDDVTRGRGRRRQQRHDHRLPAVAGRRRQPRVVVGRLPSAVRRGRGPVRRRVRR